MSSGERGVMAFDAGAGLAAAGAGGAGIPGATGETLSSGRLPVLSNFAGAGALQCIYPEGGYTYQPRASAAPPWVGPHPIILSPERAEQDADKCWHVSPFQGYGLFVAANPGRRCACPGL